MFLKKVYRYNKLLFGGMLFFILMQLFVFYKGGMVFSPWYNYGMFSEKIKPQKRYDWYNVIAPSPTRRILSPQKDDKIFVTLDKFVKLPMNDSLYNHDVGRLFEQAMLSKPSAHHYIYHLDVAAIKTLFAKYSNKAWPNNIDSVDHYTYLRIAPTSVIWNNEALIIDTTSSF